MIIRISAASTAFSERDNLAAMKLARERDRDLRRLGRVDLHTLVMRHLEERRDEARDQELRVNVRVIEREHYDREHPLAPTDSADPDRIPVNGSPTQESVPDARRDERFEKSDEPEHLPERPLEDRLKGTWLDAVV